MVGIRDRVSCREYFRKLKIKLASSCKLTAPFKKGSWLAAPCINFTVSIYILTLIACD
jgi:hypothetical protein